MSFQCTTLKVVLKKIVLGLGTRLTRCSVCRVVHLPPFHRPSFPSFSLPPSLPPTFPPFLPPSLLTPHSSQSVSRHVWPYCCLLHLILPPHSSPPSPPSPPSPLSPSHLSSLSFVTGSSALCIPTRHTWRKANRLWLQGRWIHSQGEPVDTLVYGY